MDVVDVIRQVLVALVIVGCVWFGAVRAHRTRLRNERQAAAEHPLTTLAIQTRLTELAAEVQRLERGGDEWARGHHLRAAELAYDYLLAEACARAGVANELAAAANLRAAKPERLDMELALSERGWNW